MILSNSIIIAVVAASEAQAGQEVCGAPPVEKEEEREKGECSSFHPLKQLKTESEASRDS